MFVQNVIHIGQEILREKQQVVGLIDLRKNMDLTNLQKQDSNDSYSFFVYFFIV